MVFRDPDTEIISSLLEPGSGTTTERSWQWARPQVEGIAPTPRGGHTATLVRSSDESEEGKSARIVIFGGQASGGASGYICLNDVYILDVDENQWKKERCHGTPPEPRYGHSASLVGTRVVYFGGRGDKNHFRDLHALDTQTMTWYQGPASCGAPIARHGHTSTLYEGKLFVFGGVCDEFLYFDGMQSLDLSSMAWKDLPTTGPKPCGRMGHTAVVVQKHLLIFGGFALSKEVEDSMLNCGSLLNSCYCNDIRVFDLDSYTWSRLRTHGTPPTGRYGHSLVISDDSIICFGGWSGVNKCQLCGVSNDKGAQHHFSCPTITSGINAKSETEKTVAETEVDFCFGLRTGDMTWEKLQFTGVPAARRYGHTMTAIGPHSIIFGGWDGGKSLNDLIVLRDRGEKNL